VEAASLASTKDDKTFTTRTLRGLSRVSDRVEVNVSLVTIMLHVLEELIKEVAMIGASDNGAIELRVKPLMLVADVLSQVVLPEEGLLTTFGTATNKCMLVFARPAPAGIVAVLGSSS
jgi:hypothetical protein